MPSEQKKYWLINFLSHVPVCWRVQNTIFYIINHNCQRVLKYYHNINNVLNTKWSGCFNRDGLLAKSVQQIHDRKSENETIRQIMEVENTVVEVIERLMWYAHLRRIEECRIPKAVVEWEPEGRRKKRDVKEKINWLCIEGYVHVWCSNRRCCR